MGFCRKINILYIITKLELGGAQKQLLSIIRGLDKEKFRPYIITAWDGLLVETAEGIAGLTLVRCKSLERKIHPVKDILALLFIYRFIRKNNIDIVHTHSSKAGIVGRLAARLAGVKKIIHTVHGWSFHAYQSKPAYYFYLLLERYCAIFTDAIIVVSRWDRERAVRYSIGIQDRYKLIRYAITPEDFKNSARAQGIRAELGLCREDLVIGMIACFKPQKAPLDFIKLAKASEKDFPGAKFILVGDGILRPRISALIDRLDLRDRVILTGWRRDTEAVFSCFDVFVLTSLWEGLPIVVLEAMAAGVPVIATNTGGINDAVVDGITGFLIEPADIEAGRRRLKELLSQPALRNRIVHNAYAHASSGAYALDAMVANNARVYADLYSRGEDA